MKQSTKLKLEKLINELSTPENSKKITKIFTLISITIIGLVFSVSLISAGLTLVQESGVPENVIKGAVGIIAVIAGCSSVRLCGRPIRTLYKTIFN